MHQKLDAAAIVHDHYHAERYAVYYLCHYVRGESADPQEYELIPQLKIAIGRAFDRINRAFGRVFVGDIAQILEALYINLEPLTLNPLVKKALPANTQVERLQRAVKTIEAAFSNPPKTKPLGFFATAFNDYVATGKVKIETLKPGVHLLDLETLRETLVHAVEQTQVVLATGPLIAKDRQTLNGAVANVMAVVRQLSAFMGDK